jgi:hypothetical protein
MEVCKFARSVDPLSHPILAQQMNARLLAYYMSKDRVLSLIEAQSLPLEVAAALRGEDVFMTSALLSNSMGRYVFTAIEEGAVRTLVELEIEGKLKPGVPFIYDGHLYGDGFDMRNKSTALSLHEKLDGPLDGRKLIVQFSKNGLLNDTAYTRMKGSNSLFVFAYITEITEDTIRAVPFVIGDMIEASPSLPIRYTPSLELQLGEITQFSGIDNAWQLSKADLARLAEIPEQKVKELICELLGEHEVPKDWGGEEADIYSSQLLVDGVRRTGAFLLKGPAKFHPMSPSDLGKNGDQLYRLFNIPADIYIVQHCHRIGAAVRKMAEAFALTRAFIKPCKICFVDGAMTARLLKAHGKWAVPASKKSIGKKAAAPRKPRKSI